MLPELSDDLVALRERVCRDFRTADAEHKWHRDRWDRFWRAYHSYTDWKRTYGDAANQRGRDDIVRDGQRKWGATLYIPYTYVCIETILPRMLSNRPRMLWLPRDQVSSQNTENIRWLHDAQQEKMNFELTLQTIAKTGLVTGIGIGKGYWKRETRQRWGVVPNPMPTKQNPARWLRERAEHVLYDDPFVEAVDPYDWLWDPFGSCMDSIGYCIHRSWRSTRYVLDRFESGEWDLLPDARELTAEDIEGHGAGRHYDELRQGRKEAQGYGHHALPNRHVHEVWEYHDGREVITVLNRELPVRKIENPAWHGDKPFHLFRPTEIPGSMVGKGEPEPMEDLQEEMNTMRSQRRDNASLKLAQSYFFEDGAFDPADLRFGAGMFNPVNSMGAVRDAIMPMTVGDIPNSGYQEEQALQADIERVTGLSDQTIGAGAQASTATGAQLTNAAANVRIQLKTRRLELETIKPAARQMLYLNQQHILEQRDVRIPTTPSVLEPDRVWAWRSVGPDELRGDWEVVPDGGSTAPENVPQDRQDAQMLMTGFGQHPMVDQRKILEEALKKAGIRNPERFLAPDQYIPPLALELILKGLVHMGADPYVTEQFISQAVEAAKRQETDAPAGAPGPPEADDGQAPEPPEPEAEEQAPAPDEVQQPVAA